MRRRRITNAVVALMLAASLVPTPTSDAGARAQQNELPIPITERRPVGEPERTELGGFKSRQVYRNSLNQIILEWEYDGKEWRFKRVESIYPGGRAARVTIKHYRANEDTLLLINEESGEVENHITPNEVEEVRYDRSGVPQEREVQPPNGKYRREKWNPQAERWEPAPERERWNAQTGRWEDVAENERFDAARGVWERQSSRGVWEELDEFDESAEESILDEIEEVFVPASLGKTRTESGYSVTSGVANGLRTITVARAGVGKLIKEGPDDEAAGDGSITGTVRVVPEGKTAEERARNEGELSGMVVEVDKQRQPATERVIRYAVPAAISTISFVVRDKKDKEVVRTEVPVLEKQPLRETGFDLPTVGQQGRPLEVRGPFDGDTGTTRIGVGGRDLEVLAESPRKLVARNPPGQPVGPSEVEVRERGQVVKGNFRTLGIQLSAPKLDLLRGEQTTLRVTVTGLEGIRETVPLVLENKSPGVVRMAGGETQPLTISPSQVQGGRYTTERTLTGVERGAFTITGTVVSRRQRPGGATNAAGRPQLPSGVTGGPQTAAGDPPGFKLCGAVCGQPAPEQGTGRIRCNPKNDCTIKGCTCQLFRHLSGSNPTGDNLQHVEGQEAYADKEAGWQYVCRCVK